MQVWIAEHIYEIHYNQFPMNLLGTGKKAYTMGDLSVHCRNWLLFGLVLLLILSGCTTKPQPQDQISEAEIKARSDRAFEELAAAESGSPSPELETTFPEPSRTVPPAGEARYSVPVIKGKRPDWVDGTSSQYPYEKYLTAVGYGDTRTTAEDKARSEIAKIFYSDIRSSNQTYQAILETTAGGKTSSTENVNFEEITRVSTEKVLSGVRVGQVYQDTKTDRQYYALAVLNRHQAQWILESKIKALDRDIDGLYSQALGQKDRLTQVQYLQRSIQKHILRQAYNTELRIVSTDGRSISPTISFTEIKNRLSEVLLRDFFIALTVEGPRANDVQKSLAEALNQKGFSISEDIGRANVLARGTVEIKPMDQGIAEWKFVRWQAFFDLVDRKGGAVFGSVRKSGKAGHLTLAEAEERAVRSMRKALTQEISGSLADYILASGK